jgi:hypothetical protein
MSFTNTSAMFANTSTLTTNATELYLYVTGTNLQGITTTKTNTNMHLRYYLDNGSGGENVTFGYTSYDILSVTSTRVDIRVYGLPVVAARFQPTFNYNGGYVQNSFIACPSKPTTSIVANPTNLRVSVSVANAYYVHGYKVYNANTNADITGTYVQNVTARAEGTTVNTANSLASATITTTAPPGTLYYVKAYNRLSGTSVDQYSIASDIPITLSSITYSTTNATTNTKTLKLKITGGNLLDSRVNSSNVSINLRSYTSGGSQTLYAGWSSANYSWTATSASEIELTLINLPSATLSYMVTFLLAGSSSPGYVQNTMGTLFLTVPSAPTSVSVGGVVSGGATITATGSTAYAITGYKVYNVIGNALLGSSLTNSITLTGLTNGTSYQVYVKAYGPQGDSVISPTSSSFMPGMALSTISQISTTSTSITLRVTGAYLTTLTKPQTGVTVRSVDLTNGPAGYEGTLILDNGSEGWQNYTLQVVSASEVRITVNGLTSMIDYKISFIINGVGYIQPNPAVDTLFKIGEPPGAPTNVAVAAGDTQAIVSFTAPESDGGVAITRYNVYNASSNTLLSYGASSPITIIGITNGVSYQVYVKAVNASGESVVSDTSIAFMPFSAEGPPCFFGNAPVLTPSGYQRMDSIKVGDVVLSDKGEEVQVKHVEICLCAASKQNNPYVIEAGQFGATERVLISPDHRVSVGGKMVKAKDLGLEREEMEGVLHYYNLQLDNWANMVVAGVKVESLAPIQRTVVTVPQLVSILQANYGSDVTTKEITNKVLRTCRLLQDGRVEVPILRMKA